MSPVEPFALSFPSVPGSVAPPSSPGPPPAPASTFPSEAFASSPVALLALSIRRFQGRWRSVPVSPGPPQPLSAPPPRSRHPRPPSNRSRPSLSRRFQGQWRPLPSSPGPPQPRFPPPSRPRHSRRPPSHCSRPIPSVPGTVAFPPVFAGSPHSPVLPRHLGRGIHVPRRAVRAFFPAGSRVRASSPVFSGSTPAPFPPPSRPRRRVWRSVPRRTARGFPSVPGRRFPVSVPFAVVSLHLPPLVKFKFLDS